MTAAPRLATFVNGVFRPSEAGTFVEDLNPSDREDIVALVPEGTPADAAPVVEAAARAFPAWHALTGPARAEFLHRWAGTIAVRQEELAQAMTREVGKPIAEARGEAARAVAILRFAAGEAVREIGEVIPAQAPGALQFTLRQPLGPVALITPWNFPLAIPLWKAAPALAFGNTVILKPAEAASHMATLLAETSALAGLPAGVFNVLLGSGSIVGEPLLKDERVKAVSFTGSSTVGARVAHIASRRNIRYQTEMGGKNVAIVLADADLDVAATLTASGAMRFAGQKCTATSRLVVVKSVEDAFLAKLKAKVEALSLGPVTDPASAVGPLIAEGARRFVSGAVDASGARLLTGGMPPEDPRFAKGFFYEPTVLCELAEGAAAATEELFGPVLVSFVAADLDDALAIANRTPYGLSAALFTRDIKSALHYVHRIEAGLVRVNGDTTGVDPHAPFGGVKGSSSGSREQGRAARDFYTEIKTVQVNPG